MSYTDSDYHRDQAEDSLYRVLVNGTSDQAMEAYNSFIEMYPEGRSIAQDIAADAGYDPDDLEYDPIIDDTVEQIDITRVDINIIDLKGGN